MLFPLPEVLLLVLCGTLAGAEDFVEIRRWGQMHQEFLRRLLPFKAGVPSHDTLNDVINAIDGMLFAQCFTAWVETLARTGGEPGRRTRNRRYRRQDLASDPRPRPRPRATPHGFRPGPAASASCSASRRARPNQTRSRPFRCCSNAWHSTARSVTIDAMGTQTKIAQAIIERGGDYLLALKDNQSNLHDEVRRYLHDKAALIDSRFETTDGDHGRVEVRRHMVSHDVDWLTTARRFPGEPRFPGLRAIAVVEARCFGNQRDRPSSDSPVDCVLVWKFDRFARSTRHLLVALEEFDHLGVRFVSVQDQIDTDSPMGRAMFTIIGAMAELESSLISERVTAGMQGRRGARQASRAARHVTARHQRNRGPRDLNQPQHPRNPKEDCRPAQPRHRRRVTKRARVTLPQAL